MKINKIISALALALSIGAVSCNEDLAEAPVPAPEGGVVGLGTLGQPDDGGAGPGCKGRLVCGVG